MKLGIFAKTFPGSDPAAVFAAVRSSGYQVAQYNMACSGLAPMPDAIAQEIATAVSLAAAAQSVELVAVSATYNMIHLDSVVRDRGLASLAEIAAAAPRMGTRLLTLCTGTRDPDDQWRWHRDNNSAAAWRDLVQALEQAVAIAERCDVDLGIEPEAANVIDSAVKAKKLMAEIGSPRLKIIIDPANLFEQEPLEAQHAIVADAIDLLADRIVMAHAKDRAADGRFVTAGLGVIDYPFYLRQLVAVGFDGPLVTHGLSAAEAPGVAIWLKQQLAEAEQV